MPYSNTTSPYTANGFTTDPPNGAITQFTTNLKVTGFIASCATFGVNVTCFESARVAYIVFNRMYGAVARIGFQYQTTDGTAVNGVDYTSVSGTVMWEAFDIASKVVQVPLLATTSVTSTYFNFNVTPIGGAFFGFPTAYHYTGGTLTPFPGPHYTVSPYSFQVTIIRQGRGTVNFVGTPYSVQRPGGTTTVTLQVQRFNGFKGAVGVSWHTTDGTAVSGVAYTGATGTLSWSDLEGGTKNITITILSGGSGTQSFTVTIDTPTGGVSIGSTPTATVNIVAAAPPANPTAGGSIPQQLFEGILVTDPSEGATPGSGALFNTLNRYEDQLTSFWRNNITFNAILADNKINGVIGFAPGNDSFGGGTDYFDGSENYIPLFPPGRFDGYITGG